MARYSYINHAFHIIIIINYVISCFSDISCIMLQTVLFTYITAVVFKLYSIMTPPPPSCRRLGFQSTIHLLISNYRLELIDNQTLCVTFKSHLSWIKFSNTIYSEKFQTLILDNPKFKSCELASIWTSEHEIWWVFLMFWYSSDNYSQGWMVSAMWVIYISDCWLLLNHQTSQKSTALPYLHLTTHKSFFTMQCNNLLYMAAG